VIFDQILIFLIQFKVDFDDPRDAEDAIRGRDGYNFDGYRLRVESPRGTGPSGRGGGGRDGGGGGSRFSGKEPPRGRFYRVMVTGLPASGSWQDLKDHMREVCLFLQVINRQQRRWGLDLFCTDLIVRKVT